MPKTLHPHKVTRYFAIRDIASGKYIHKSDSSGFMSLSDNPSCYTIRRYADDCLAAAEKEFKTTFELVVLEVKTVEVETIPPRKISPKPAPRPLPVAQKSAQELLKTIGADKYIDWLSKHDAINLWETRLKQMIPYYESKSMHLFSARYFYDGNDYEVIWDNSHDYPGPDEIGIIRKQDWSKKKKK